MVEKHNINSLYAKIRKFKLLRKLVAENNQLAFEDKHIPPFKHTLGHYTKEPLGVYPSLLLGVYLSLLLTQPCCLLELFDDPAILSLIYFHTSFYVLFIEDTVNE